MAFKPIRVRDLARALRRTLGGGLGAGRVATLVVAASLAANAPGSPRPSEPPRGVAPDPSLAPLLSALEADADPTPELLELAGASPIRLRAVVEAARRPLGSAAEAFVARLEARPDSAAAILGLEFAARLANPDANRLLAARLLDPDPLRAAGAGRALAALAPIAALESCEAIARHLRSPIGEVAAAARAAGSSLVRELLAEARTDDALAVLDRFLAEDPGRLEFEASRAFARGVYAGDPEGARADLAAIALPGTGPGALGAARAELELAAAAVAFFAGEESGAIAALAAARARLGEIPERKNSLALTAGRIDFVVAVAALAAARPDEAAAREAMRRAIEDRPHDDGVYLGDNSLFGPAGARAWLEHLRRNGRPEVRRTFYRLLRDALSAAEPPAAADDEIPARSWAPVWQAYALLDDGRLDEVVAEVAALVPRLERATAWTDRWMVAELDLARAIAEHLGGDSAAALARIATIDRRVAELAGAEVEQLAFESREIVPSPGAPPLRDSLRDLRMRVERLAAEASFVANRPADALRRARLAVAADPFDDATTALELAAAARADESLARAQRAYHTLPRAAGALLDLARLAFALGKPSEGEELFERHLRWNALTDERRALELARRGRDPSLAP